MPITISGDGGIAGVTNLDGGDFECATLVASGDTTLGPQAVGRASLFVDDSANSVGINTTTPAAAVFLEVADGTNPIVSLNNTGNGEVRLGCTSTAGYIGTESNHPFNIETNSTIKAVVLANGNIGVGNTSPTELIELRGNLDQSNVFLTTSSTAANSGSTIAFQSTTNGWGLNGAHASIKGGRVNGSNGYLDFSTRQSGSSAVVMRLDENSRVGIGTTSPQARLHVVKSDAAEETPVRFRNFYNDGVNNSKTNLRFEMATANNQGGTAVIQGVCGTDAGGANTQNDGGLRILVSSGGSGTLSEAATFTKLGNLAFPNGQGIDFSATEGTGVNSSILDDYEEGTWTPVIKSGSNTITYTGGDQQFYYQKIGNMVTVTFSLNGATTAGTAGGPFIIEGLPFNSANISNLRSIGTHVVYYGSGLRATGWPNFAHVGSNTSNMDVYTKTSTAGNYDRANVDQVGSGTYFFWQVTYQTA